MMATTQNLGKIGFLMRGEYAVNTAYSKNDVVTYNGSVYAAKKSTTGNTPTNSSFWVLMLKAPKATVEQTSNGAKISITDKDGTTTATVTNGSDANVTAANISSAGGIISSDIATANKAGIVKLGNSGISGNATDGLWVETITYSQYQAKENRNAISKGTLENVLKAKDYSTKNELSKTDRSLNALWKLNEGVSYQFETDSDAAYSKTVPTGAKLADIQMIGGKSVVSEAGVITHADVDKIIYAKGAVTNEQSITSSVKSLTGYGWGLNGTCYNYVDWENKLFVRKVGKYTFTGKEGWVVDGELAYVNMSRSLVGVKGISNSIMACDLIRIPSGVRTTLKSYSFPYTARLNVNVDGNGKSVIPYMTGVDLYYELATPVITDISDLLEPIEVEAGGTLTFHQTDDTALQVPNSVQYAVKLSEVTA